MNLEVAISKDLISYINEDLNNISLDEKLSYKILNSIKTNFILFDSNKIFSTQLLQQIENLNDSVYKNELKKFISETLYLRGKPVNLLKEFGNLELDISLNSEDKIYINPILSESEIIKFKNHFAYKDIDIYNRDKFINPPASNKLQISKNIIQIEILANIQYDLKKILFEYLKESKIITYIDPYMANYKSLYWIKKIFNDIQNCKINFHTLTKELYCDNSEYKIKEYKNFIDFVNSKQIELVFFDKKTHIERYIKTDKYDIMLPGGFDQFKQNGERVAKSGNTPMFIYIIKK